MKSVLYLVIGRANSHHQNLPDMSGYIGFFASNAGLWLVNKLLVNKLKPSIFFNHAGLTSLNHFTIMKVYDKENWARGG
jgi:hypothetical protein